MYWKYFLGLVGFVVLAVAVFIIFFKMPFSSKIKKINNEFINTNNAEKFIEENLKLFKSEKSKYNQALCCINISAGYCDMEDYEKAKITLLNAPYDALSGHNKTIYNINLAYIYFMLHENDKALEVAAKNRKAFSKLEGHPLLGGNIAAVNILSLIDQKEYKEARKLLQVARETWAVPRLEKDWDYLESKCNIRSKSLSRKRSK